MVGTGKPTETPASRVLAAAARENLGEFERRVRRRPGLGGAAVCLVILVIVVNFLFNGPESAWGRGVVTVGLLIVTSWGYVWFQRVRGGLYLFSEGFVDTAGRRVVSVAWSEIRSRTRAHQTHLPAFQCPGNGPYRPVPAVKWHQTGW
ncbi:MULTISPECIES: hypothetical protein [unclassified Streptomyces]|uniref:hypothetical protein n=1 Tax=unclassified Streptomyces TaxID=2593676 RepID=UPI0029A571DE|nr:hypothetical protein [Streptomyces sp. DK15]MDX2391063.1 hypothetical protein [Streptomyces sp. DK15]